MTYLESTIKKAISLLLAIFLFGCEKDAERVAPDLISVDGVSTFGGPDSYPYADFSLVIPSGALENDQFLGYFDSTITYTADTTYIPYSSMLTFIPYNCNTLSIPGSLTFYYQSQNALSLPNIRPYSIGVNENIYDSQNWQPVTDYIQSDTSIYFQFSDLNRKYLLGWKID